MRHSFMRLFVLMASGLAGSIMAVPAYATETSFASFSNAPNGSFIATNTGTANGSLTLTDASVVSFSYLTAAVANISGVAADFTFSASSSNSNFSYVGGYLDQTGFNGFLKFTSTSAITVGGTTYAAGSNLLTATFTDAELFGQHRNALTTGDSGVGTLVFTSDFLNFSNTIGRDYSISLNGITPSLAPGYINGQAAYIQSFVSTPAGNFASDPAPGVVPEPATWAMMLFGLGAIGLSLRGNLRRRTVNA